MIFIIKHKIRKKKKKKQTLPALPTQETNAAAQELLKEGRKERKQNKIHNNKIYN